MATSIDRAGSEGKGTETPGHSGLQRREILKTVAAAAGALGHIQWSMRHSHTSAISASW